MDDIEEILDEFMISLNTEVNDGSLEEVQCQLLASVVCRIFVGFLAVSLTQNIVGNEFF